MYFSIYIIINLGFLAAGLGLVLVFAERIYWRLSTHEIGSFVRSYDFNRYPQYFSTMQLGYNEVYR